MNLWFWGSLCVGVLIMLFISIKSWKHPTSLLYISLAFLVLGEVGRISLPFFGQELLILDLLVLFSFFLYIFSAWWRRKNIVLGKLFIPFFLFVTVAFLSLLFQIHHFENTELFISFSYLVRFIAYFGLYIIARNETIKPYCLFLFLLIIALALAALGFIQFVFYPDFSSMETFGWDPHIGRLLSTWFDPNFLGGFFSFIILLILNVLFDRKQNKKEKLFLGLTAFILFVALVLTFSRSAYLMFFVGLVLTGLRAPRVLIVVILFFIVSIFLVPRAQERVQEMVGSMFALAINSYDYGMDETAKLRVASWEESFSIFYDHPLLGIGYDTMRYEKLNRGDITDPTIHSGSGADSSLLTILVTTGIIGFLFFLWMIVEIFHIAWKITKQQKVSPFIKNFSAGFVIAFFSLLMHSFFVNSLLLPFFLVLILITIGIEEQELALIEKKLSSTSS